MFIGNINQSLDERYLSSALIQQIQMAFNAIKKDSSIGRNVLIENQLNYVIIEAECSQANTKLAEIHKLHIDVHLVLSGREQIGYATEPLIISDHANAESDLYFGTTKNENYIQLTAGEFAVFFPDEVHKPLTSSDIYGEKVTKAIIKIRYDGLE